MIVTSLVYLHNTQALLLGKGRSSLYGPSRETQRKPILLTLLKISCEPQDAKYKVRKKNLFHRRNMKRKSTSFSNCCTLVNIVINKAMEGSLCWFSLWLKNCVLFVTVSLKTEFSGFRVSEIVSFKFCSLPSFPGSAYLASLDSVEQGAHGKRWAAVWNAGRDSSRPEQVFLKQKLLLCECGGLTVQTLAFSVIHLYTNSVIYFLWKITSRNQSGLQNSVFCLVGYGFCSMISVGLITMLEMLLRVIWWLLGLISLLITE